MRRSLGYAVEVGPLGVVRELDSSTCGHCQRVTFLKPQPAGVVVRMARCGCCGQALCEQCYEELRQGEGCKPWEKRMEELEARDRLLRSIAG